MEVEACLQVPNYFQLLAKTRSPKYIFHDEGTKLSKCVWGSKEEELFQGRVSEESGRGRLTTQMERKK